MKKRNGFTLIELLAVIVILAVIALIAVPRIIEILNKSRISAAEDSTYGIVEAAESYVADFLLQNHGVIPENLEFTCISTGCNLQTALDGYNTENLTSLEFKGKKPTSGTITVSDSGNTVEAKDLVISGYTCNYKDEKASCADGNDDSSQSQDEYNWDPLQAVTLGGYNWHVIEETNDTYTLLMDAGQLGEHNKMNHCTDDTNPNTDCGVLDSFYQYSWDKSKIRTYLNGDFLKDLENSIVSDKLVATDICADSSLGKSGVFSYGGYLRSEIGSIEGATCNSEYVKDKVRLITISEFDALSPYYKSSHYSLQYGGQFASKPHITRAEDSSWLYSSSIDVWWTMGAYSDSASNDVRYVRYVTTAGEFSNYYGNREFDVRPVITIHK